MPAGHHNRLLFSGSLPDNEIWQTSVAFRSVSDDIMTDSGTLNAFLNDDTSISTWAGGMAFLLGAAQNNVILNKLTAQYVNSSGVVGASAQRFFSVPGAVTASSDGLPNECAVVVSLRTTVPGPRGRGRMYLPWTGISRTSSGNRITSATITTQLTNMLIAFSKVLGTAAVISGTDDWWLCVASNAGAGGLHLVTTLQIGDVIDAQRRRRNRQGEAYQSVAAPTS